MSNFTPGKWGVHPAGGIYADQEPAPGESLERRVEVWLDEYTEEHKANARLIAAAPEMYELLKKFVDKADVRMPGHDVFDADGKLISWVSQRWVDNELIDKTNALMRRVEGDGEE